jgi:hypothetical protein
MNTKEIIGGISFCILMIGVARGNIIQARMIREINRKRQGNSLISYFGFTPSKNIQIIREYRDAYPEGKLYLHHSIAIALLVIGMIGCMVYILT